MLCKSKKPLNDQKMSNFRLNAESLNHFHKKKVHFSKLINFFELELDFEYRLRLIFLCFIFTS